MENEVHDYLGDDQGDIVKREREQKLQSYREASRKVVRDYLKERVANQYYGGIALGKNHQSKVAAAEFILRYLEDSPHANLEGIENHPDYRLHYRALDQDIFGQGMQSLFGASKLGALFHELTTVSSANIKRFYATDGYLPRLIEGEDNISLQSMGHHTLQDLDKHYVNLLLTDQKRGMRSINIAELFNADAPDQPPPDKLHVLITGAAGMGKSTLMRYITYHWGKGELYQNRFDYVFRVQWKLAVGNWVAPRSDPHRYQGHLKSNLIGCFVDYSLRQDFNAYTGLGPDRLLDIFNQRADRVLLLLDGYDEVSASNDESVLGIIEELFKLPYVAVTSRPEAIGDSFKSDDRCFDRCMNLLGFSREAMNVYVSRYFEYLPEQNDCTQQRQREVKLALLQPSIYRLVKTPLNLALLCAVSVANQQPGWGQLTLTSLYNRFIHYLLSHRMITNLKKQDRNAEQTFHQWSDRELLKRPEVMALKQIAYESWAAGELVISHRILVRIEEQYQRKFDEKSLSVEDLLQLHLLRIHGYKAQESECGYVFVHFNLQEYLCAHYLFDQLHVGGGVAQETLRWLSAARYQPKYWSKLKPVVSFLAQFILTENEAMREAFWTAMTANIDGMFDCNLPRRIELWMHLLAPFQTGTGIDERIPQGAVMASWIDAAVTMDPEVYAEAIAASGYDSAKIREAIQAMLALNDDWFVAEAERLLLGGQADAGQIEEYGADLRARLAIRRLQAISESPSYPDDIRERAAAQLQDHQLSGKETTHDIEQQHLRHQYTVIHAIHMSVALFQGVELLTLLKPMLLYPWTVKQAILQALTQAIKDNGLVFKLDEIQDFHAVLNWHIDDNNLREDLEGFWWAVASQFLEDNKDAWHAWLYGWQTEQRQWRQRRVDLRKDKYTLPVWRVESVAAARWVVKGLKEQREDHDDALQRKLGILWLSRFDGHPESALDRRIMVEVIVPEVEALLKGPPSMFHPWIAYVAGQFWQGIWREMMPPVWSSWRTVKPCNRAALWRKPQVAKTDETYVLIWLLTHDESSFLAEKWIAPFSEALRDSDREVRVASLTAIEQILLPRPELFEQFLSTLSDTVQDASSWQMRHDSILAIGQLLSARPELAEQFLDRFSEALQDFSEYGFMVRAASADAIGQILSAHPHVAQQCSEQLLHRLSHALQDEHWKVSAASATTVGQLLSVRPELIEQLLSHLSDALQRRGDGSPVDNSYHVRVASVAAIGHFLSVHPEWAEQLLGHLSDALRDFSGDPWESVWVRVASATAIGQLLSVRPELADRLLNGLSDALQDFSADKEGCDVGYQVRSASAKAIGQLLSVRPELAEQLLSSLSDALRDSSKDWRSHDVGCQVRAASASAIGQLLLVRPELAEQCLHGFLDALRDSSSWQIRHGSVLAMSQLLSVRPELAKPCLHGFFDALRDSGREVRSTGVTAIGQLLLAHHEWAEPCLNGLFDALRDSECEVRSAGAIAIGHLLSARPELAEQCLNGLFDALWDSELEVRSASAIAIGQILSARPELAKQCLDRISDAWQDSSSFVRAAIATIIKQLLSVYPHVAQQFSAKFRKEIYEAFLDEHWEVRMTSVTVIGQLISSCFFHVTPKYYELFLNQLFKGALWDYSSMYSYRVRAANMAVIGQFLASYPIVTKKYSDKVLSPLSEALQDFSSSVKVATVTAVAQSVVSWRKRLSRNVLVLSSVSKTRRLEGVEGWVKLPIWRERKHRGMPSIFMNVYVILYRNKININKSLSGGGALLSQIVADWQQALAEGGDECDQRLQILMVIRNEHRVWSVALEPLSSIAVHVLLTRACQKPLSKIERHFLNVNVQAGLPLLFESPYADVDDTEPAIIFENKRYLLPVQNASNPGLFDALLQAALERDDPWAQAYRQHRPLLPTRLASMSVIYGKDQNNQGLLENSCEANGEKGKLNESVDFGVEGASSASFFKQVNPKESQDYLTPESGFRAV